MPGINTDKEKSVRGVIEGKIIALDRLQRCKQELEEMNRRPNTGITITQSTLDDLQAQINILRADGDLKIKS